MQGGFFPPFCEAEVPADFRTSFVICSSLEGFSLPLTAEVGVEDGLHSCMVKKICRVFVLRAKTCFDQDGVTFALSWRMRCDLM